MKNERAQVAFELFNQGLKLKEIAEKLGIPQGTVRRWKCEQKWDEKSERSDKKKANVRTRGAPKKNKNAAGNVGGSGAPVKHGLFSKYFTEDTRDIYEELQNGSPLELLWHNIMFLQAEILRSQQIMHVKDSEDMTTTQIGYSDGKVQGESFQVQQAWDKQGNYLKSLSRVQAELRNMIKDYLELEGKSKTDASAAAKDWKAAIIEIAKRRAEHSE